MCRSSVVVHIEIKMDAPTGCCYVWSLSNYCCVVLCWSPMVGYEIWVLYCFNSSTGMALPTASPVSSLTPQVIGSAFVQQYYHILHRSPEMVHKFYQDSSIVNRPNSDGEMTSVMSVQAINDMIMSLDFRNCFTEIETADSQISYRNGVLIVVTGSFIGQDAIRRKFAQSFFLAPQENGGYFVLNDVFRFLSETQQREMNYMLGDGTKDDPPQVPISPEAEPTCQEHDATETPLLEENADNMEELPNQSEDGGSGFEDEVVVDPPADTGENDSQTVHEVIASGAQDDLPKKSYASIVKVMKGSSSPLPVYTIPKEKVEVAPQKPVIVSPALASTPELSHSASNNFPENNNNVEEEGHSIYIRNLSLNATAEQVEEEFKKFGPIKPGGVQVRSHKVERYCFGFVEFESLKSMQAAIEASPVMIGGHQATVEEKRTTTRVVNGVVTNNGTGNSGRGRFQLGRGAFRNDNFRGRDSFSSNMGYRRNEFRNRAEYSGRGSGPGFHGSGGFQQRAFQNGDGTIIGHPRGGGPKITAVSA
ncbi:Nuclear transport factor 2 (NTF2) domain [Musa troglodytarum]|uniref:Nuclear transport factor 2 (NTF2) domain n=1 Tax=Musa troglodytarum TaxID=320322 RepID=A0A9E7EA53_9LILI|nr:Nuclear transport factor 2 (NTF2) domain [Musa troglodytarum]